VTSGPHLAWLTAALLTAACYSQPRSTDEVQTPPNIVVFFVDDLGWQDVGEPFWRERTSWNDRYQTPNLARLCREGTKFTNAYAHQVCTPSRVSLMTGAAVARHRVSHWTLRADRFTDPQRGDLRRPSWNLSGLSSDPQTPNAYCAETLAHRLDDAGYQTIMVGKAHFGAIGTPGADPTNLGFDVNVAGHAAGAPSSYLAKKRFRRAPKDQTWQVPDLERYHGTGWFLTEALTDEAIAAAAAARRKQQPFFLYLSHYAVHTPLNPDARFIDAYREAGLPEPEARYAALIEGVDRSLGRVLNWLDQADIAKDTIVMFVSDNGGLTAHSRSGAKHTHNAPLRSGKGSAYEGGIRVPMAVRWPREVASDAVEPLPVQLEDVMPTLCELAGVDARCPDGQSFAPALRGQRQARHPLFFHSPHYWGATGPGIEPYSAVRDGDLKLIWFYDRGAAELYNLADDVGETEDLAARRPRDRARLQDVLRKHLAACDAQFPARSDGEQVKRP